MPTTDEVWANQQLSRAVSFYRGGNLRRARDIAERVVRRVPEHVEGLKFAGQIARREGDLDRALGHLVAAAQLEPSDAALLEVVGATAAALDRFELAIEALEYAVVADPVDGSRQRRLGQAYFLKSELEKALGHARLALMLDPQDAAAHEIVGSVFVHLDRPSEAMAAYEHSLALRSDDARTLVNAALALDALGRGEDARSFRERARDLAPEDPAVAFHTKDLEVFAADDERIDAVRRAAYEVTTAVEERVLAHLSLAKMLDDAGETAEAAQHLRTGNQLRQTQLEQRKLHYRPEIAEARLDAVQKAFPVDQSIASRSVPKTPQLLLLTGLPRSGKSLLEARLAHSPSIVPRGESRVLVELHEAFRERTGSNFPIGLDELSDSDRAQLWERLWEGARLADEGTDTIVTVTVPDGIIFAGFLAQLDPRTRVVYCQRDPGDLLLASYMQWFPNNQPFAWSVEGLAHNLRVYERYADHWSPVLGDRFRRVSYEDLVAAPNDVVLSILRWAGVEPGGAWRPLTTRDDDVVADSPTSKLDPNAPLHRAHVGMWQRWSPHLPELAGALEQAGLRASSTT